MNETTFDHGGPAFPVNTVQINNPGACFADEGMTLWDYYAAAALQGVMAHQGVWNDSYIREAATAADAMLAERRKRFNKQETTE